MTKCFLSRFLRRKVTLSPRRDVLILLGSWGLELAVEEVDELLMAAGYKALVPRSNLR